VKLAGTGAALLPPAQREAMPTVGARLVLGLLVALLVVDVGGAAVAMRAAQAEAQADAQAHAQERAQQAAHALDARLAATRIALRATADAATSRGPDHALAALEGLGATAATLTDAQGNLLAAEGDALEDAALRARMEGEGLVDGWLVLAASSSDAARRVAIAYSPDALRLALGDDVALGEGEGARWAVQTLATSVVVAPRANPDAGREAVARFVTGASLGIAVGGAAILLAVAPALGKRLVPHPAPRKRAQVSSGKTRLPR